jgi:hypothetical protein
MLTTRPPKPSGPNKNGYLEYSLRGKGGWCVGLTTYHLHVPIVLKFGSVNLLESSGPVQVCNGIAFLVGTLKSTYILRSRGDPCVYDRRLLPSTSVV